MPNRLCALLAAVFIGVAGSGIAQPRPSSLLQLHQLVTNVYWVEGGGGNSGVIIGDKGIIVIDAKTAAADAQQLLNLIAHITEKPVTTVILTHSDDDVVDGLVAFPKGIPIIAHINNQKELEADPTNHGHGYLPAIYFPNLVVTRDEEDLEIDGMQMELLHWGPAHTAGDLIIYLPNQKIVFAGDILSNAYLPVLHHNKDSSSEGWIATAKGILALDANRFVPGRGNVVDKQAVETKLVDAEMARAKIVDLVNHGKSLKEIETAVCEAPPADRTDSTGFCDRVYRELTGRRLP